MSTLIDGTHVPGIDRPTITTSPDAGRTGVRRWAPLLVTIVVFGWSTVELIDLGFTHTIGAELYGVLAAALATGAGLASLALLGSPRPHVLLTIAVLVGWAVVAIGGVAGSVAHVVGPLGGHGPPDLRPRPIAAPLIFTLLGLVGGAALAFGKRPRIRRVLERGTE